MRVVPIILAAVCALGMSGLSAPARAQWNGYEGGDGWRRQEWRERSGSGNVGVSMNGASANGVSGNCGFTRHRPGSMPRPRPIMGARLLPTTADTCSCLQSSGLVLANSVNSCSN